ncbi:hypothetical protein [Candidatus Igneacidithiobacillus taiwanensis]|nr:hypothetical protein [Candidatus Igneacidithiobacillus taiwanensis]
MEKEKKREVGYNFAHAYAMEKEKKGEEAYNLIWSMKEEVWGKKKEDNHA